MTFATNLKRPFRNNPSEKHRIFCINTRSESTNRSEIASNKFKTGMEKIKTKLVKQTVKITLFKINPGQNEAVDSTAVRRGMCGPH